MLIHGKTAEKLKLNFSRSALFHTNTKVCRIYFCQDCSYIDNKETDILTSGKGPTQGLDDITLIVETKYLINCAQLWKRFVLSLCYNRSNSFLFVNATKIYRFK